MSADQMAACDCPHTTQAHSPAWGCLWCACGHPSDCRCEGCAATVEVAQDQAQLRLE